MIRTLQGAWWEILFGTLPSRNRRAPVIPLLPTTITVALTSSATSRIASAGSPSRACVSTSTPGLGGGRGARLENGVDVLARADGVGDVARDLAALLAQAGGGNRLVGADDVESRTAQPGQLGRLANGLGRRIGPVCTYDDSLEQNPTLQSPIALCGQYHVARAYYPRRGRRMPPTWKYMMVVLVVCLIASMVIAITKLT